MILAKQAKLLEKLITDNSPTILSAVGIVGTVATAYLTGKASFKASEIIADAIEERKALGGFDDRGIANERVFWSNTESFKLVWKEFIPAVGSGVLTVTAIFGANRISARRAAALAVAYSISEKRFDEFKEKVYAKLTPQKQEALNTEIAQSRLDANTSGRPMIIAGSGDVMCYDLPSDRYFKSNMERLRKTENDMNQQAIHDSMPVPLSDFYRCIGLKPMPYSEEVGWTETMLMDIDFSTAMTDDSQPCIVINYDFTPIRGSKRLTEYDR